MNTPQTHEELIQQVEAIDPEAAEYLRTEARELESFTECAVLNGVFIWDDSPQGHDYWNDLYTQVYAIELGMEEEEFHD